MENNSLAMETLILCYIEAKYLLRTKQLDQSGFNKLLIKSCKEFNNYSNEEILTTWRNLVRQYLQVKNNSLQKESWKYYKIMDSCYDISDFHQCGQSKFSEEMVWFLIECLLKRRTCKRSHNMERMNEVYHEFLEEGYVNLIRDDIQTKWRYLNYRYSKLQGNKDASLKMPYFTAIDAFRNGKKCVKMVFTKSLTEILIKKFTQKRVMCNFHGYDSPQLLNEIQSEFQNLDPNYGFEFSCEEIRDEWDKLTNIYEFLKKKHKTESQWEHFQAMREHFEDNVIKNETTFFNINEKVSRKRSNSDEDTNKNKKSKLTVDDDDGDERSMSPLNVEERVKFDSSVDTINSIKTQKVENKECKEIIDEKIANISENESKAFYISKKKRLLKTKGLKKNSIRDFSPEASKINLKVEIPETNKIKNTADGMVCSSLKRTQIDECSEKKNIFEADQMKEKCITDTEKQLQLNDGTVEKSKPVLSTYKENQVTQIKDLPNNSTDYMEQTNYSELPASQNHVNNIYESRIHDDNGNNTINFPSISKKFSGNEFLPLKKRLRLNEDKIVSPEEIKDGFRGFSVMDQVYAQLSCHENYNKWREDVISEVTTIKTLQDQSYNLNNTFEENCRPEENCGFYSFHSHGNVVSQCDVMRKDDGSFSPVNDNRTYEHNNGFSPKEYYRTEDESMAKGGCRNDDPPHRTEYRYDDILKEGVSTELIETSIVEEPFTEVEIRAFEQYQTPERANENRSDDIGCDISKPDSISVEENTPNSEKPNLSANNEFVMSSEYDEINTENNSILEEQNMSNIEKPNFTSNNEEFNMLSKYADINAETNSIFKEENTLNTEKPNSSPNNKYLNMSVEYPEINTKADFNNTSNNAIKCHTKCFGSAIIDLETQVNQTDRKNAEQTEDNPVSSLTDILRENEAANSQHYNESHILLASGEGQTEETNTAEKEIKSVRLPVTCGGKLKEIFISPRELSKIAQMKPKSAKLKNSPIIKEAEISKSNCKNIKFMSQVIKEANTTFSTYSDPNQISNQTLNDNNMIPPASKEYFSAGILNMNEQSFVRPVGDYDGYSMISESVVDDEQVSDDLLADVIEDFQVQSNQELKDIKSLIRENNVLQRETNKILRQILDRL